MFEYANQTAPVSADYHVNFAPQRHIDWDAPGLEITRLRIVTDRLSDFWDVSYCHGYYQGEQVWVSVPFTWIPKKYKGGVKGFIIDQAKEDGVYAKGTGILDVISKLW